MLTRLGLFLLSFLHASFLLFVLFFHCLYHHDSVRVYGSRQQHPGGCSARRCVRPRPLGGHGTLAGAVQPPIHGVVRVFARDRVGAALETAAVVRDPVPPVPQRKRTSAPRGRRARRRLRHSRAPHGLPLCGWGGHGLGAYHCAAAPPTVEATTYACTKPTKEFFCCCTNRCKLTQWCGSSSCKRAPAAGLCVSVRVQWAARARLLVPHVARQLVPLGQLRVAPGILLLSFISMHLPICLRFVSFRDLHDTPDFHELISVSRGSFS